MVKPETAASWLQKMVRAEAALASTADVMLSGQYTRIEVPVGQCACVTCGIVLPWSSPSYKGRQMQGGHWIPKSQGREMLMLLEDNVWPQCSLCNLPETRAGGWGNREPVGAPSDNGVTPRYMHMRKVSIYSGSNEIQHNIFAKAVLGL